MRSIKNLIKVMTISGIITLVSLFNINNAFASDNNNIMTMNDFCAKYGIVNNGIKDNTLIFYLEGFKVDNNKNEVVSYSNGSWEMSNNITNQYAFKPIESDKEIVLNNYQEVYDCVNSYKEIKKSNESPLLKSAFNNFGMDMLGYSNKNYTNDLSTDAKLEEYATKWLKDNYNLTLDIPVQYAELNKDCTDITQKIVYGGFNYKDDKTPISINIEEEYKHNDMISEKILIHELTHFALDKLNKPFNDNDECFNNELLKNGGKNNYGKSGDFYSNLINPNK